MFKLNIGGLQKFKSKFFLPYVIFLEVISVLAPAVPAPDIVIPRVLFLSTKYKGMSLNAKLVYGFLYQCLPFCSHKGWVDDDGNAYLLFTQSVISESLCLQRLAVVRAIKELSSFGLIVSIQQGMGIPNKIYVHDLNINKDEILPDICQNILLS